ncbi:MAG: toll/interleukin-1 receptor domain-containing protein [Bacteroidales bacterium]|nr:toll/interleukin-1 receptor domain-containing protein [Bacteroidales bacterium]
MENNYIHDVFISYSRKDTAIANMICQVFDKNGITYFIDRQGIGGGLEFPAVLAKGIRESKVFLFLASKNSYESKFTQSEIVYAFNKKQKQDIIPYIIDGSTLPDELEFTFSAINWRRIENHPIETILIDDILQKVGKERKTKSTKSGNIDDKEVTDFASPISLSKNKFNFTGRTLAIITLSIAILSFVVTLFLPKSYIHSHFSTIENIWYSYLLLLLLFFIIGIIRPASICLHTRKEVSKYYLSSIIIVFISACIITSNDPQVEYGFDLENTYIKDTITVVYDTISVS